MSKNKRRNRKPLPRTTASHYADALTLDIFDGMTDETLLERLVSLGATQEDVSAAAQVVDAGLVSLGVTHEEVRAAAQAVDIDDEAQR